jgi:hypothetical protein
MARLNIPPPSWVVLGAAMVNGQKVEVTLNPEWARYFDSLNTQVNQTTEIVTAERAAGFPVLFGIGGDESGNSDLIPGPRGLQGDPGQMAAMFLDGGDTERALEFVQGPQGAQGPSGAVVALMCGEDAPTELLSRPASSAADVGLGNVTNDAQTKAAIMPNTAPSAGQIPVGNAGGTAYAPVTVSGDATLSSAGALTVTKTNGTAFGALATVTPGTGIATALAVNVGTAGAPVVNGGALGTPSSGALTNCTSVPVANATGTLAVANGGTGDTGTAWSTYTPSVTAAAGTITTLGTVAGRYKQLGKTLILYVDIPITTNGTGSGSITCPLPAGMTFKSIDAPIYGRDAGVTGNALTSFTSAGAANFGILFYNNAYPGANGARLIVHGVFEIA